MGLMDKVKNLFTEEVEDIVEEPIKKEVIQVEIPSPVKRDNIEEEKPMENQEPEVEPKQDEYKFPFFDDEDFSTLETEETTRQSKKKSSYRKDTAYKKEAKEVYSPVKEEKKVFKPTPIISPVYGILDKNYQKEDIRTKSEKPRTYYNAKEATVDEIRNKAYGTLEDDIETTLFGHNRALFEDEEPKPMDIVEDNIQTEEEVINVIENEPKILSDDIIGEKPRHISENSELEITDLLEEEMGKDEVLEEQEPRKISDTELFDMIDSMYQKGDK